MVTPIRIEALHAAIRHGHLAQVQSLVEEQKQSGMLHLIEAVDEYGYTALHVASQKHFWYTYILHYLVQRCGAVVEAVTHKGMTPLILACQEGHTANIKCLIEVGGANVDKSTPDGSTPLHILCRSKGNLSVVQYLVERCGANVLATNKDGCRPIHLACANNTLSTVRYLGGTNATGTDHQGCTALHYACRSRNILGLIRCLIETGGVDVTAANTAGVTVFHEASCHSDVPALRYLIQRHVNLFSAVTHDGTPALQLACRDNGLDVVQYLASYQCGLPSGVYAVDHATNHDGYTALHFACQRTTSWHSLEIVQFLVETCGIDVTAPSHNGTTALHVACGITNNVTLVQYLVEKGSQVAAVNSKGESAVHIACRHGDLKMVQYLIEACYANVDGMTHDGSTTLSSACQNKFEGNMLGVVYARNDAAARRKSRVRLVLYMVQQWYNM